jgi:hypothetical protein
MKIKGQISILINREYTTIEVRDDNANTTFAKVTLTPEQLSAALSRQMYVECELDVRGLDRIGKQHENKSFEFEITEDQLRRKDSKELHSIAQKTISMLNEEWIAEDYFSSQDSTFTKNGKYFAKCTIRRGC